jgi:hypothetical protein
MPSSTPDARAVAWFSTMLAAAQRGSFEEAAKAQHELASLGWRVSRLDTPRPEDRRARPRPLAARPGGAS